ncbi:HNH endonuclease [Mesorhizobium sp. Root172]|uniref:HNH endonuclease n=1 Tax=Mesorhizobium sp. Root172 TaxID=1736481 RepID=UPI0009EA3856|nr:HNH endonuclease [Mesorhizobium sp. Root172]
MNGEPLRYVQEVVLSFTGEECLIWPYSGNGAGYGTVSINGKNRYVHRMACEKANGPAPTPRHEAAHTCGRGKIGCVNPGHLVWKTHPENMKDSVDHGSSAKGTQAGSAKLTEENVREIRALHGQRSQKDIGEMFGVSRSLVSVIHARKSWGWLDD